ncbi:MAG: GNAT family N-acetyltransferase [Candidatus Hodarchaeota archaeon]
MSIPPSTKDFPPEDEEIHIEELTEADATEIAELLALVWPYADHIPLEWRNKRVLTANEIITEMQKGIRYFGARLNNRLVGFYKTVLTPEGVLGEHQTVHPNYRHRGLVRAMYRQFINYAREGNAPGNLCNILEDHLTMRALVESFGFRPKGSPYEQAPGMWVQLYFRPVDKPN